jgi:hypothetical protein
VSATVTERTKAEPRGLEDLYLRHFFLSDHGDLDEGGTAIGYDAQGREVDRIEFG